MQNCCTTEAECAEVQWHYNKHNTGTCGRGTAQFFMQCAFRTKLGYKEDDILRVRTGTLL
jgi:hypothetical protein